MYENRYDMVANEDSSDLKGKLNSKVFGTDLSAVAATYIHWRLLGLGARVAVTLSPSLSTHLLGCQSQYKRREGKGNKE